MWFSQNYAAFSAYSKTISRELLNSPSVGRFPRHISLPQFSLITITKLYAHCSSYLQKYQKWISSIIIHKRMTYMSIAAINWNIHEHYTANSKFYFNMEDGRPFCLQSAQEYMHSWTYWNKQNKILEAFKSPISNWDHHTVKAVLISLFADYSDTEYSQLLKYLTPLMMRLMISLFVLSKCSVLKHKFSFTMQARVLLLKLTMIKRIVGGCNRWLWNTNYFIICQSTFHEPQKYVKRRKSDQTIWWVASQATKSKKFYIDTNYFCQHRFY